MTQYNDLQIRIDPQGGNGKCRVELLFYQHNSLDAPIHVAYTTTLDTNFLIGLYERNLSVSETAQWLSAHLFGEHGGAAIDQMIAMSEATAARLRVRLIISPGQPELHRIPWEKILHTGLEQLLQPGERMLLSRYLLNESRRYIRLRPRLYRRPHVLVAIANPQGLDQYFNLRPIDVAGEVKRITETVDDLAIVTSLVPEVGQGSTVDRLLRALSLAEPPDILYLLAHGAVQHLKTIDAKSQATPIVYLERADGTVDAVTVSDLAEMIGSLEILPRLVIIGACNSGGDGYIDTLRSLGPALVQSGVPAVIAMQGFVGIDFVTGFMPVLLREIMRDGHVDRALAEARAVMRPVHKHWWMPVLFTRSTTGRIWADSGEAARQSLIVWLQRQSLPRPVIDEIANAILACPSSQALTWSEFADFGSLLDWLAEEEQQSRPFLTLIDVLDRKLPQRIPVLLVRRLVSLLRDVQLFQHQVRRLFAYYAPEGTEEPPLSDRPGVITSLVRILATAEQDGNSHPLLKFLDELLIRYRDMPTIARCEDELHACRRELAGLFGAPLESPTEKAAIAYTAVLQVQIRAREATETSDVYFMRGWLSYEPEDEQHTSTPIGESDESYKLIELPQAFRRLVASAEVALVDPLDLRIEVFLPTELLLLDVERWSVTVGRRSSLAAGRKYQVIVRSLDRTMPQLQMIYRRPWLLKWRLSAEARNRAIPEAIAWIIEEAEGQPVRLLSNLHDNRRVALIQLWLPGQPDPENQIFLELLDAVLGSGIPIAIFVRPGCLTPAAAREILSALIDNRPLRELAQIVHQIRRDAIQENDLGEHIILLWDDPDHPLPGAEPYPGLNERRNT